MKWRCYVPETLADRVGMPQKRTDKPKAPFSQGSEAEVALAQQLVMEGLTFAREYRFHPARLWRLDFWFADAQLGVEVQGGGWTGGRHSRGGGIERDCEKSAYVAIAGYRLMMVTPSQIKRGQALEWIRQAVGEAK